MAVTYHVSLLTVRLYRYALRRLGCKVLVCARCGLAVDVGARALIKYPHVRPTRLQAARRREGKVYHEACWNSLFLEV